MIDPLRCGQSRDHPSGGVSDSVTAGQPAWDGLRELQSSRPGSILIAMDTFKGSIDAKDAVAAIAGGLRTAGPQLKIAECPIADGGEGTVAAALRADYEPRSVAVTGPLGETVTARYAVRGRDAVLEASSACGLGLVGAVPTPDSARRSSSFGVGELIRAAVEGGARHITIGVGGTASTDGGAGLASALGLKCLDGDGQPLQAGGVALQRMCRLDTAGLLAADAVGLVAAVDVQSPLYGARGAALTFAKQKGALDQDALALDRGLRRWAELISNATGADIAQRSGMGAGGGIPFALAAIFGARIMVGAEFIFELANLEGALASAAVVITGEGSLDSQSLEGKGPVYVSRLAMARGIPAIAVVGRNLLTPWEARSNGIHHTLSLSDLEPDPARSISEAAALLRRFGYLIGTAMPS